MSATRFAPLRSGYPRSLLVGATFAAAWSPCIGPILGAVLTLATASGTWAQGALLLSCYSLGLGVWFLVLGAAFGRVAPRLRRVRAYLPALMVLSGALFIVVGALMLLGEFARLNSYFRSFGFLFERTASTEQGLQGGVGGLLGPGVAFFGGVVSFFSPCVLPLVPVYLANLAGEAALVSAGEAGGRCRVFAHALTFVAGFSVVFAALGASVGLLGNLVPSHLDTLTRIGGLILIAMGLQVSGLIQIPYLRRTYQLPAP